MSLSKKAIESLMRAAGFLLALLACPVPAQPFAHPTEIVTHQLSPDHFVAGALLSVDQPVPGDLIPAGGDLDVSADVAGDTVVSGGHLRLSAAIEQGVYAAGGRIVLDGSVGRNVRMVGGRVDVGPRAKIAGNVTLGGR